MAALVWGAWGEEWALAEKVSFNGTTRTITVNAGVTSLNIRSEVYSAWVRWVTREANARFLQAMRAVGGDPIPGGETGLTFFMVNGWKLIIDPNVVAVTGVLYSEDYATAYWSASGSPIFPATVSALVNSAVSYQNVVTGDLSSVPDAAEIAAQVRAELLAELIQLTKIAKLHGVGENLVVTPTSRTAGDISQTITTVGDTTTVSAA